MTKKPIYLDNAATTPLDPAVLEAMLPYLTDKFGNPSSIYSYGRETRLAIENARKSVASILNAHPAEIFFTSGGTESANTIINGAVHDLACTHIITSPIEHHATLHTVEALSRRGEVSVSHVDVLADGHIDLAHLDRLLAAHAGEKTLVSLLHANNEIGNITDLEEVGRRCLYYGALFHADTVQTVGHLPFDLRSTPVHFITGSGHKFHGPKGAGLLYINENVRIMSLLHGGSQERNMRAGTENVYGIIGFARALELATAHYATEQAYINGLKTYAYQLMAQNIPEVDFNGDPLGQSLYTVLSVRFPKTERSELLLLNLDIHGICASGGSACTSGADQGSHVIRAINNDPNRITVRFSFSKLNTKEEIEQTVQTINAIL